MLYDRLYISALSQDLVRLQNSTLKLPIQSLQSLGPLFVHLTLLHLEMNQRPKRYRFFLIDLVLPKHWNLTNSFPRSDLSTFTTSRFVSSNISANQRPSCSLALYPELPITSLRVAYPTHVMNGKRKKKLLQMQR